MFIGVCIIPSIAQKVDSYGPFEEYFKSRGSESFSITKIKEVHGGRNIPLLIIFVNGSLLPNIQDEINDYNASLVNHGYQTVIFSVSGGTVEDIKNQILSYWDYGYNVTGGVLIGDIPVAWFHHQNDTSGPAEFPCDLFLMDLDGIWQDTNQDGMYDTHTGNTAPEMYVGRIDASKVPGDEIAITKNYFQKDHEFWTEQRNTTNPGLTYTDKDWVNISEFRDVIRFAYPEYQAIGYPNVSRDDYLQTRLPGGYDFIQLTCHSSSRYHNFWIGGSASSDDVRAAPPEAFFYSLICCYASRFTDENCLGNAYIFNTSTPSLTVIGSTKAGGMLYFNKFYKPLGQCCSIGSAFTQWFDSLYPYGNFGISQYYGMTILGDPTLQPIPRPIFWADANGPYTNQNEQAIHFNGSTEGGETPYQWHWEFGDGTSSEEQNPVHAFNYAPIPYTVTLTVTDHEGEHVSDVTTASIKDLYAPQLTVEKPQNFIYIANKRVLPFFIPIVIGFVDITALVKDNFSGENFNSGINRVLFYIDETVRMVEPGNASGDVYTWRWSDKTPLKFPHEIWVQAYDNYGNYDTEIFLALKFL